MAPHPSRILVFRFCISVFRSHQSIDGGLFTLVLISSMVHLLTLWMEIDGATLAKVTKLCLSNGLLDDTFRNLSKWNEITVFSLFTTCRTFSHRSSKDSTYTSSCFPYSPDISPAAGQDGWYYLTRDIIL